MIPRYLSIQICRESDAAYCEAAYCATLTNSNFTHMAYRKYAKMESDEELGGNISTPQNKDAPRKFKSEQMSDINIHTNVFQEINIL